MSVSIFGFIVVVVCGLQFLFRSPLSILVSVLVFSVMGGSAAIILTSLGGSSVRPALLAMIFLGAATFLPGGLRIAVLPRAIVCAFPIVIFCIYSSFTAFLLPNIYAGEFNVVPLNPRGLLYAFDTTPLQFTNQNITTSVYMLATMLSVLASYIAVQQNNAEEIVFKAMLAVVSLHVGFGIADVVLSPTPFIGILEFFRNADYAQHNQSMGGLIRINGIFPEPSGYASFAIPLFVVMCELWIRSYKPRTTGIAAVLTLGVLIFSLSSTAVVAIMVYFLLVLGRVLVIPAAFPSYFYTATGLGFVCLIALVICAMVIFPEFAATLGEIFVNITVEKSESKSGSQRLFWAKQGLDFFSATYGIGIGSGSFRSSSIVTAILGSTGIIGIVTLSWFVLLVIRPMTISTYQRVNDMRSNVGSAFAWGTLAVLLPQSISGASPDPGIIFGMFGGISLGLRYGMQHLYEGGRYGVRA